MSSRARRWLKTGLQALVSAGLVIILVRQLDLAEMRAIVMRPHGLPWLLAAVLLFNASKVVGALRLNIYQRAAGIALGELANIRLYYAGMFLNLCLPGGIGGDGYKILVLHRRQAVPLKKLVLITLADRLSGMLCLLLLLCLLMPLTPLPWPGNRVYAGAAIGAVSAVSALILAHRLLFRLERAALAKVCYYGMTVQLLQLACIATLLAYVQLPVGDYGAHLAVFLVSSIAAVLPLSLGGIGARELTFFYGLKLLQLDPAHGVVVSSVFFLITLLSSLVGALFLKTFSSRQAVAPGSGQ
ncbi:MAG: lysylphosphatidylglycerol synthase transmembrane domain-containing protein [Noviherbaspirillum sp.]